MFPRFKVLPLLTLYVAATDGARGEEVPDEWERAVAQLRDSDFFVRERASATLASQPEPALPWLRQRLAETPAGADPEFRMRLAGIIGELKGKKDRKDLEGGFPISLALEDADPEKVLAALDGLVPRRPIADSARTIWGDWTEKPFAAEGSYWEVVDAFFDAFPPKGAEQPGREEISRSTPLTRFDLADVAAVAQPHTAQGVLRIRVARTAIEHSNGRDYLSVTLVPKIVPAFLPEELSVLLKAIHTEGGGKLVPVEPLRSFSRSSGHQAPHFQPGEMFTWSIPLEEGAELRGPLRLELVAQLKLRRLDWEERKLPPLNHGVAFEEGIALALEDQAPDTLKIKFSGPAKLRFDFFGYPRNGQRRLFDLIDESGEAIGFRLQGSSSGGGDPWYYTVTCKLDKPGEVASVRALVPGKLQTIRSDFELEDVRLPGR